MTVVWLNGGQLLFDNNSATTYHYIDLFPLYARDPPDPELHKQRERIVRALKSRLPPYWYDPVAKEWKVK